MDLEDQSTTAGSDIEPDDQWDEDEELVCEPAPPKGITLKPKLTK